MAVNSWRAPLGAVLGAACPSSLPPSRCTEARTERQPGMAQPARPRSRRWIGPSPDCERGAPGPCTPGLGGPQA